MRNLLLIAKLDVAESLRSRWFLIYMLVFMGLIVTFIFSGVTDSRVLGFSGLTRLLLLFIQICIVIVPIFILISTVRSISADRDTNLLEYMLSFPVSLGEYYFGKALGRIFVIFVPLLLSFVLAVVAGLVKKIEIPWDILSLYTALLFALSFVFLSFGFLISSMIKNQEMGQGVAFLLWLILLAFLDLALIGFLMKTNVREDIIFFIALINPIEVFRIAAISLFDPNLAVIGVASNFVLNNFSAFGFVIYSIFYPLILGAIMLVGGYFIFSSRDLV